MSRDFGDLVLVIGDLHVPSKARELPECFMELLQTDKIKWTVRDYTTLGCSECDYNRVGLGLGNQGLRTVKLTS